jgi:hypothetical protein
MIASFQLDATKLFLYRSAEECLFRYMSSSLHFSSLNTQGLQKAFVMTRAQTQKTYESMLGVDLLLPDITYLQRNCMPEGQSTKKIVGVLLSHGHEDHIGGLPYIVPQLVYLLKRPDTASLVGTPTLSLAEKEGSKALVRDGRGASVASRSRPQEVLYDENPRHGDVFPPFTSSNPDAELFAQVCSYRCS